MALEESRWSIAVRATAAEQKQDEKAENGALAKRFHFTKKAGRGSFATAPSEQELSVKLTASSAILFLPLFLPALLL